MKKAKLWSHVLFAFVRVRLCVFSFKSNSSTLREITSGCFIILIDTILNQLGCTVLLSADSWDSAEE